MPRSAATLLLVPILLFTACDDGVSVVVPTHLGVVAGNEQLGVVGQPLEDRVTVRALGDDRKPAGGITIEFRTEDGSVSPTSVTTDAQGNASTTWTLGTSAGPQELTASVGDLSATASASAGAGPASAIEVTGRHRVGWTDTLGLVATVTDAYGNENAASLEWSSQDTTIATVRTAVGLGTTGIVVRVTGTALADTFAVTVTPKPDASLAVSRAGGCLLDETGAAFCWGANNRGQLGTGTSEDSNAPVAVAGGHRFAALGTAIGSHVCALNDAGQAYCWGANGHGQLGTGTSGDSRVPVAVAGDHTFHWIGAGQRHTCALDPQRAAYCWGDNEYGQIGDATLIDRPDPTPFDPPLWWDDFAVGGLVTCGVYGEEGICWGYNGNGAVGDGTTGSARPIPGPVDGDHAFVRIRVGAEHACGITTDSDLYCWGYNADGQLGIGTTESEPVPVHVADLAGVDNVSAGSRTTCARVDGRAYCWGGNEVGQVGDGAIDDRATPREVQGEIHWTRVLAGGDVSCGISDAGVPHCWGAVDRRGDGLPGRVAEPVPVGGGHTFGRVSAGHSYTCGLEDGGLLCWGMGTAGQLGTGDLIPRDVPVRIGGRTFKRVAAGPFHACGLDTSNHVACWGRNDYGQLGTGNTVSSPAPAAVMPSLPSIDVAVGAYHSCALTDPGLTEQLADVPAVFCWGRGSEGQIGDGTTDHHTEVQGVAGSEGARGIRLTAGDFHTCAIWSRDGTTATYCWGDNQYGQLGDWTTTTRFVPVEVSAPDFPDGSPATFSRIAAGGEHTCAMTADGVAFCWGSNQSGQLGDMQYIDRWMPQGVAQFDIVFSRIDAGARHSCGVDTEGTAYCWGLGTSGQLGTGSLSGAGAPVPVAGGHAFVDITAGSSHTCAIAGGAAVYCWGDTRFGALGQGYANFSGPTPVAGSHVLPFRP